MTMGLVPDDADGLTPQFALHVADLNALAARCDAMCLTAGVQLGDAVPGLYDLSSQFASLSEMLVNEGGAKPAETLETVAHDLLATGTALAQEREAVAAVITLNAVLTRRIGDLADNVRFLSSVVSNVKIEIATINEGELRLEGFADNLKQLASKSEQTVTAFQATHQTLIKQLQWTAKAQSAFVSLHGAKFATASQEISSSLGAVSDRRQTIASVAGQIGGLTQQIGAQIAQCVVALQIGDSTRQRLEHAAEALAIAADVASEPMFEGEPIDDTPGRRDRIVAGICGLAAIQTDEATTEFAREVGTVAYLIEQITTAALALTERGQALGSTPGATTGSFLADLESKLASASDLIEECGHSRKLVDDTGERVIASVLGLQDLATNVAAMATDMMIIGTNAVVTSYRLGTKGIPLSVIAQHLRNHAVRVTDAVKLVSPALDKVMEAAKQFTSAREGQDAGSMEEMALRITEALAAFKAGDAAVAEVGNRLDVEVTAVGGVLRQASDALQDIDDLEARLLDVADIVGTLASAESDDDGGSVPPSLDRRLRERYTMGSERAIHDAFFANWSREVASQARVSTIDDGQDASVWL